MSVYADEIRRQRAELEHKFQSRLDELGAEGRAATTDEAVEMDAWEADIQRLSDETRRAERAEALRAASDALRGEVAPRVEQARDQHREPTDREMLQQLLRGERREFESRFTEHRALQSEGGSAVPTTFADFVSQYMRTVDPTTQVARIFDTPDARPLVIPRWTADAAGGGTVTAENGGITVADGTISAITLNAFGYKSIQPVSTQLWRDAAFSIEQLLAETAGRQLGIAAGSAYAFANGSTGPNGYVAGGSAGHTATGTASGVASDTFFSPADIVDLFHSVVVPWRAVGSWMVSTTAMSKIRKFRDSQGMYMYDPGIANAPQPTLLGRPVYENPSMAAVASATKSVIFGDWSQYAIRRVPLRVDVSTEFLWGSDGVAVRTILETDGDILHPTAIRPMVSANT